MRNKLTAMLQEVLNFVKSPRGEAIRYIIIGGCTTLVDYAIFYLMETILHINVTISNITSTALAVAFAYVTNKLFVFESRTTSRSALFSEFVKFIGSRFATSLLEVGGVFLFVNILGQDSNLGKAEIIVIVIIVNYFLSKYLVFRKKTQQAQE